MKNVLAKTLEVRWHGRGGQGAWTASEFLARAAIKEGKYIQSFPEFGPERMGAPVRAFTRISNEPIQMHCAVYNPDVVAVLDPSLLKAVPVTEGLNDEGILIVNSKENPAEIREMLKNRRKENLDNSSHGNCHQDSEQTYHEHSYVRSSCSSNWNC